MRLVKHKYGKNKQHTRYWISGIGWEIDLMPKFALKYLIEKAVVVKLEKFIVKQHFKLNDHLVKINWSREAVLDERKTNQKP